MKHDGFLLIYKSEKDPTMRGLIERGWQILTGLFLAGGSLLLPGR
jgi:hypothetical protein